METMATAPRPVRSSLRGYHWADEQGYGARQTSHARLFFVPEGTPACCSMLATTLQL
jgi:hypothetical protein